MTPDHGMESVFRVWAKLKTCLQCSVEEVFPPTKSATNGLAQCQEAI